MLIKLPSWEKSSHQRRMLDTMSGFWRVNSTLKACEGDLFVVKVDGSVLEDDGAFRHLAEDVAILRHAGIGVVLVHGGAPQVERLRQKLRITPTASDGGKASEARILNVRKMVCAGALNIDLVAGLTRLGVPALGLSGVDGRLLSVRGAPEGLDHPLTGGHPSAPVEVNCDFLKFVLKGGYVPVIAALAMDDKGAVVSVDSDGAAEAVAKALKADRLLILTDSAAILIAADETDQPDCTQADEAARLLANDKIAAGMVTKVGACVRAVAAGVKRAYIIQGIMPGALFIEMLTGMGGGTVIAGAAETESLRKERAGGCAPQRSAPVWVKMT